MFVQISDNFRTPRYRVREVKSTVIKAYTGMAMPNGTSFWTVRGRSGVDCPRQCLENPICFMTFYKDNTCFMGSYFEGPLMSGGDLEIFRVVVGNE
jgi:hypothetical protein